MVGIPRTALATPDQLRHELDQVFSHLFGATKRPSLVGPPQALPRLDLWQADDTYFVEAELPGVTEGELAISAIGRQLTLSVEDDASEAAEAAEQSDKEHAERAYLHRERRDNAFRRVIEFPSDIDVERIEAQLERGILSVKVPKAATAKPRRISVQGE